jgi:hypothetical protein
VRARRSRAASRTRQHPRPAGDGAREAAVATAFTSERHLRVDGRTGATFAPLSGFWRTADGWVRTHANYPHHKKRLVEALGIADDPAALARGLTTRRAVEVQEPVYGAGGLAVAVATEPAPARRSPITGRGTIRRPSGAPTNRVGDERVE